MSALTIYAANALLDGTPMPTTLYLAGYVGNPGPTAAANIAAETRRIGFVRNAAASGSAVQAAGGAISNAVATETWTHFALFDDVSAGDAWWIGAFSPAVSIIATNTIRLLTATITLTIDTWS